MCSLCTLPIYRFSLCREHWKLDQQDKYHCTWNRCLNPVFSLTLCRTHYRAAYVSCAHPHCNKPSFCKQVCKYHYYKKQLLPLKICQYCDKSVYMDNVCFYHFTWRTCSSCNTKIFSKGLCQKHYMKQWRQRSSDDSNNGATANNDRTPDIDRTNPAKICHIPETQSS